MNPDNVNAKLFSVLNTLETLRLEDGTFHLELCYPELSEYDRPCNEWSQTSNPVTESTIQNFVPIHLSFAKNSYDEGFVGLGVSPVSSEYTLIDDAPGRGNWWMAIGARRSHGEEDTIPGPYTINVKRVELYAKKPGTLAK